MKRFYPCKKWGITSVESTALRLIFSGITVSYPQLKRFKGSELADLFAKLHHAHGFESFEQHGDVGATMETEGANTFDIFRDRLAIEEHVRSDFEVVKRNALDVFHTTKDHFPDDFYTFRVADVTLRALWPCPAAETGENFVSDVLREHATNFTEDQFEVLGEVGGVSLTLHGVREDPVHSHFSLEIAPYWRDETQIYVEVSMRFYKQVEKVEVIGERLQITYDFLSDNITKFVKTFLP